MCHPSYINTTVRANLFILTTTFFALYIHMQYIYTYIVQRSMYFYTYSYLMWMELYVCTVLGNNLKVKKYLSLPNCAF